MDDITKQRCDQLFKMGLRFNGDSYVGAQENNDDFNFHHTEMMCDTEEEWNRKIESVKTEMIKRGIEI